MPDLAITAVPAATPTTADTVLGVQAGAAKLFPYGGPFAAGTITASTPHSITQTWNNAAINFVGLRFNATITAANNSSLLFDLQAGGVSQFSVDRYGTVTGGTITLGTWVSLGANTISQRSAGRYVISSTTTASGASDIGWVREAAGTGAVTDGSSTPTNYRDWKARNLITVPQTVATLIAAATAGAGARSFVTDASATTFLSTVAGGGANSVPVVSNGTNWLIG